MLCNETKSILLPIEMSFVRIEKNNEYFEFAL